MPFIFVSGDAQLFGITPLHSPRRALRAIAHDSAHLSPGPFVGDLSGAAGVSRASRHFSISASQHLIWWLLVKRVSRARVWVILF